MQTKTNIHSQLSRDATTLALIDALREDSDMPRLGKEIEMAIVDNQLRDLVLATKIDEVDQALRAVTA